MVDARFFGDSASGRPTEFGTIFPPDEHWLAGRDPEPSLEPDLEIVDAHHHLWWRPFSYGMEDLSADLSSGGHNVTATVFVECGVGYRQNGPEILRPVGETEYVVHELTTNPTAGHPTQVAAGIVGYADLTVGARVEEVLHVHLQAGAGRFRGVRFSTGWDASDEVENTQAAQRSGMLAETGFRQGARVLARLGLSFDAWVFHTQLGEVAALATALPELTIVLDHCGGPLGYGPYARDREQHFAAWRSAIAELARIPNVSCKLGGLLARGAAFDYLHAPAPPSSAELATTWEPWLHTCIEAFGTARCMFESNFPVEKMGVDYTTLWNAFKSATRGASAAEREALFAGTARSVYRLPGRSEHVLI